MGVQRSECMHLAKWPVWVACGFVIVALAACGGSSTTTTSMATTAPTVEPTVAPTVEPTVAASAPAETSATTDTVQAETGSETETMPAETAAMTETESTESASQAASETMTETMPAETASMTDTGSAGSASQTASEAMTATVGTGAVIMVRDDAKLGSILTDANGMTLYVFDKDSTDSSACTDSCLEKWPALTVSDAQSVPAAGDGVSGTLAVFQRDDGTYQVSINGMPLYYYALDAQAGDTSGQGVGSVWWAVDASGAKVTAQ